jgi:high-affinity K+ transport system ATPase subunit B
MSWIGTAVVLSAVGAGVSAYGQYQAGKAQKETAEANARQLELDRIAEEQETREAMRRQRMRNQREMAAMRVKATSQGVDTAEGTPLQILAQNQAMMELSLQDVKRAGDIAGYQKGRQAQMQMFQGAQAYKAGLIGAGGSVLSGAGQVAFMASQKPEGKKWFSFG